MQKPPPYPGNCKRDHFVERIGEKALNGGSLQQIGSSSGQISSQIISAAASNPAEDIGGDRRREDRCAKPNQQTRQHCCRETLERLVGSCEPGCPADKGGDNRIWEDGYIPRQAIPNDV